MHSILLAKKDSRWPVRFLEPQRDVIIAAQGKALG